MQAHFLTLEEHMESRNDAWINTQVYWTKEAHEAMCAILSDNAFIAFAEEQIAFTNFNIKIAKDIERIRAQGYRWKPSVWHYAVAGGDRDYFDHPAQMTYNNIKWNLHTYQGIYTKVILNSNSLFS
jgi:hypothetical protein